VKNKKLLSLLETTASLQAPGEGTELKNLGHELAQKLRGGQLVEETTMNGVCGPGSGPHDTINSSCNKG